MKWKLPSLLKVSLSLQLCIYTKVWLIFITNKALVAFWREFHFKETDLFVFELEACVFFVQSVFCISTEMETQLPPHEGDELSVVDMHTGGEPLRVILSGYPEVKGDSVLAKRRYVREHLDHLRRALMYEPRGHYDMYGALIVDSELPEADLGVLFMHNEGYSTMCGHAVIALGRFAVDYKLVKEPQSPETQVNVHCPCGLVKAFVEYSGGKTGGVRFFSVPAFAFATGRTLKKTDSDKVIFRGPPQPRTTRLVSPPVSGPAQNYSQGFFFFWLNNEGQTKLLFPQMWQWQWKVLVTWRSTSATEEPSTPL